MSPRNFARVFARETGVTPGRFVERLRIEAARRLLEETDSNVKAIAARCGFGGAEALRIAFLRTVRVSPTAYRERFRTPV
jgi:transcriptional regulator GlxA family with amidase domain